MTEPTTRSSAEVQMTFGSGGVGGAQTAYEYVRSSLRAAVLDGTLRGGTRLLQTDLAAQLGVSTTPVREALRDLATEGLVTFDSRRGAVVRSLDISEIREVYELRQTLEPLMVRRALPLITTEQLVRADRLKQLMDEPTTPSAWSDLNASFHAILHEPDDHSRLAGLLSGLRDSAAPFVALSLMARPEQIAESNAEHAQLIELYRSGDSEAAVDLSVRHLRSTLNVIELAHARGEL
jgi:DNA-binding GntR family transcriptional regulator